MFCCVERRGGVGQRVWRNGARVITHEAPPNVREPAELIATARQARQDGQEKLEPLAVRSEPQAGGTSIYRWLVGQLACLQVRRSWGTRVLGPRTALWTAPRGNLASIR